MRGMAAESEGRREGPDRETVDATDAWRPERDELAVDASGERPGELERVPLTSSEEAFGAERRGGDVRGGLTIRRDKIEAAPQKMFPRILERFRSGATFTAADYVAAWRRLMELRRIWAERVAAADAVILPTSPILPPNANRLMTDDAFARMAPRS